MYNLLGTNFIELQISVSYLTYETEKRKELLDEKNNGFVISSLFVQDGNRVYAKAIKDGNSEHTLSNEEKEAINKAIKSQK